MKKIQAAGGPQVRRQNQQQRRARTVRRRQEARRRRATHRLGPVAVRKGLRRREFLVGAAGAGAVLAAPSLLGGCHHDEEVKPGTILFNLSHEDFSNKTYFLTGGGKTYRLTRVSDVPTSWSERAEPIPFSAPFRTSRSPITSRARSTPPTRSRCST